ncbi:MAG: twin-arginine translocase TatA/TatE family subunit [Ignavibacteriales bacterium]|jgi:TatA/E family protein of Tat protein translocase|nr:twin-arginine translocase TatA/TatE family subunit [Melioribacteraceae bacterium]RJP59949.1 MAG: twin-arginine translocase TatA/TatE family subunit [Ignavibacteriales bacterium]
MFGSFGATEILIIVFALLLLFGGKKLPELAKGIGKGIKELKTSMKEVHDDINIEKELKS